MKTSNIRIVYRLLLVVVVGAIGSLIIAVMSLGSLREKIIAERKAMAQQQVETALSLIGSIPPGNDAQATALSLIERIRYDGSNYVWIGDLSGTFLMHPLKPQLVGKSSLDQVDASGSYYMKDLVNAVKQHGSGFVSYTWQNPGEAESRPKIGYVTGVSKWGWIVGTGIYIDDADKAFRAEAWRLAGIGSAVLFVALIVAAIITRGVVRPLSIMTGRMKELADGHLDIDVPFADRKDEIGSMAAAVLVFKERGLEVRRLQAEQEAARARSEAEKRATTRALADDLEARIADIIHTVNSAATELEASATSMTGTAKEAQTQSEAVASASDEVSQNAQTVAGATEELSSSILEISRQLQTASEVVATAVRDAAHTDALMTGLTGAAERIGTVIDLIGAIAKQTNLLALNATIEAARAGDQGRGFAVVATEVKRLAEQTAKATSEIQSQVTGIQSATTDAVKAIRSVSSVISRINGITSTVAAAVEQQNSATREISSNIQQAAVGTVRVSEHIEGLAHTSSETGAAAAQVQQAASGLAKDAVTLQNTVDQFVAKIRAA